MRIICYVTTKIVIDAPEGSDPQEVLDQVTGEMDYDFSYDEDGVKIADTEIFDATILG